MEEVLSTITAARRAALNVANSLIMTAIGAVSVGNIEYADAVVIAVLRVIDGYEAITQLPDVHDIASDPHGPVPFHPVR